MPCSSCSSRPCDTLALTAPSTSLRRARKWPMLSSAYSAAARTPSSTAAAGSSSAVHCCRRLGSAPNSRWFTADSDSQCAKHATASRRHASARRRAGGSPALRATRTLVYRSKSSSADRPSCGATSAAGVRSSTSTAARPSESSAPGRKYVVDTLRGAASGTSRATASRSAPSTSRSGHALASVPSRAWLTDSSWRPEPLCCCAGRSSSSRRCSSTSASSVASSTSRCSYDAYSLRFVQFSSRSREKSSTARSSRRSAAANGARCTGTSGVSRQIRASAPSKRFSTATHVYRSPRGHTHCGTASSIGASAASSSAPARRPTSCATSALTSGLRFGTLVIFMRALRRRGRVASWRRAATPLQSRACARSVT